MTDTGARGEISRQPGTVRLLFPLPAGEGRVRENLPTGYEAPFLEMLPFQNSVTAYVSRRQSNGSERGLASAATKSGLMCCAADDLLLDRLQLEVV